MRSVLCLLAVFTIGTLPDSANADDSIARQYAKEAVENLTASLQRLQSSHAVSQAQVAELQSQLFSAQLLAAQLGDDVASQTALLQRRVETQTKQLARLQDLAKRGYAGRGQLRIARLKRLSTKQQLALLSGDDEAVTAIIQVVLEIETAQLRALQDQASRGYASTSAVTLQKLRIADLIANQHVSIPETDR